MYGRGRPFRPRRGYNLEFGFGRNNFLLPFTLGAVTGSFFRPPYPYSYYPYPYSPYFFY